MHACSGLGIALGHRCTAAKEHADRPARNRMRRSRLPRFCDPRRPSARRYPGHPRAHAARLLNLRDPISSITASPIRLGAPTTAMRSGSRRCAHGRAMMTGRPTRRRRIARGGADSGPSARWPASPRRSAWRGCRRTGSWRPVVMISTGLPCDVDGVAGHRDARGGLERDADHDVLAGGDAAEHAAGMIALEALRRQLVAMLGTALRDAAKPGADLHALDGVDAHHRAGQVGIEALEHRLAQARRHAARDHRDARADRIARPRGSSR